MIVRTYERNDGTVTVLVQERQGKRVSFSGGAVAENLDAVEDALLLLMAEKDKGEATARIGMVKAGIGRIAE
jgi:hypothetical protein